MDNINQSFEDFFASSQLEQPNIDLSSPFYHNLLVKKKSVSEDIIESLTSHLLNVLEDDRLVREEWIRIPEEAIKYLGFDIEEDVVSAKDISDVKNKLAFTFDLTFSNVVLRTHAILRGQLFPPNGPAGYKNTDIEDPNVQLVASKVIDYFNFYLTTVDKGYYPNIDRFLLFLIVYGCIFRKTFRTPDGEPQCRFIPPRDLLLDNDCNSAIESNRITHIRYLTKREIIENIDSGIFKQPDANYLNDLNANAGDAGDNDRARNNSAIAINTNSQGTSFKFYEIHTYENLEEYSDEFSDLDEVQEQDVIKKLPLPYIITICATTEKMVSLTRNWAEDDKNFKRLSWFTHYNLYPGFTPYGLGYAHLYGSQAKSLTRILRLSLDAGAFQAFPAGFRVKGMGLDNHDMTLEPAKFISLDTGGLPINQAFGSLPFNGPSAALIEMGKNMSLEMREGAGISELGIAENNANAPVGTTLALLEAANVSSSAILRTIHHSLTEELQLLFQLFKQRFITHSYTKNGKKISISQQEMEMVGDIVPNSEPTMESTTQKLMKSENLIQLAGSAPPGIFNMYEVYKNHVAVMGIRDADKFLLPDPEEDVMKPLDPVSENINIMLNKPVKAHLQQDHTAHIIILDDLLNKRPDLAPVIDAHRAEHQAMMYQIQMQQMTGIMFEPPEQLSPEMQQTMMMQNEIAMTAANALQEQAANNPPPEQQQQQAPIDPGMVAMAEIEAKQAEANLNAEVKIFTVTTELEKEKARIEADLEIAKGRVEVEMAKIESNRELAHLKANTEMAKTELKDQSNQQEISEEEQYYE